MIVLPASALPGPPVIVSVVSLVMRSPGMSVSSETEPNVGAEGALVSIVTASGALWADAFPASSTACDVTRWTPSVRGAVVMLQLPFPSTTVVPASTPST